MTGISVNSTDFKPMLSGKAPDDLASLKYPVLVSPKLDGIRAIVRDGVVVSRNLKPIPNKRVQWLFGLHQYDGLDGELIVGEPTSKDVWNRTQSGVMSESGDPAVSFYVFDRVMSDAFLQRHKCVGQICDDLTNCPARFVRVPQRKAENAVELSALESMYVAQGYEGVMIRSPSGPYKFGRSTTKEGYLLKWKRWHDAEAVVVDFVEQMHNGNEATKDELGRTKRTTHKANKRGKNTLGALVCSTISDDGRIYIKAFELGTGFDDATRSEIWDNRHKYREKIVKFKYQDMTPAGVPRFPVFLGFRSAIDA